MATRRRILITAVTLPAVFLAGHASRRADDLVRRTIGATRPRPEGTSATRCAQCGSPDHAMLDARCPLRPRVLA